MKLKLKNIGMLRDAELTLHPLCVIAGENDNGKSTVGKIVFCIVKAISRYKEDLLESKEFRLQEAASKMIFTLRSILRDAEGQSTELAAVIDPLVAQLRRRSGARSVDWSADQEGLFQALKLLLDHPVMDQDRRQQINQRFAEFVRIVDEPEDQRRSIEKAFSKVFAAEFDDSLLLEGTLEGSISLSAQARELIHLEISKAHPQAQLKVRLRGTPEPLDLRDATFIESPLILNYHDVLSRSQTLLDMDQKRKISHLGAPYTTLHTKDLFDKLRTPVLPFDLFGEQSAELVDEIQQIIGGKIAYDKGVRDFIFSRQNNRISIKNTASGIKVFGLLQILLSNDFVAKDTMLIFDEPENHLHPKWQLKLAEVLLRLVQHGVAVLVSSHSPYLIEALKRGVDRAGLAHQARFALAQAQCIGDTDRLGDIFAVLAEPFEVFRQMDAEELRGE